MIECSNCVQYQVTISPLRPRLKSMGVNFGRQFPSRPTKMNDDFSIFLRLLSICHVKCKFVRIHRQNIQRTSKGIWNIMINISEADKYQSYIPTMYYFLYRYIDGTFLAQRVCRVLYSSICKSLKPFKNSNH